MKSIIRAFSVVIVVFGVVTFQSSKANAISCSMGDTCIEELTRSNNTSMNNNIDIRVIVDNSNDTYTKLKFQWISGKFPGDPLGLDTIFYNDAAKVNSISGNVKSWSFNFGGTTGGGGFGNFASDKNLGGGETGGIGSPLVLSLNSLVTSFPLNGQGSDFDVHIRYGNCSGWVSNGRPGSSTENCGTSNSVPEPGSLLLLGSGLIGFALSGRRKLFN